MKSTSRLLAATASALLAAGAAPAAEPATAAAAAAPATSASAAEARLDADRAGIAAADRAADKAANEPTVTVTVIDDSHARIEELRVRGQLQKVTVRPKDGAPSYEIIVGDGSRDLSPGVQTTRGRAASVSGTCSGSERALRSGSMAVYTEVSYDEAARLIAGLGIGTLTGLSPCVGGIENTNYFADTERGRFVLTLFERLSSDELPFYLGLMKHLADAGLPVPGPHADITGALLLVCAGKPAAVVDRLPGEHHLAPDAADCAGVGRVMAALHAAAAGYTGAQPNLRGLAWCGATVPVVLPCLTAERAALMQDELAWQQRMAATAAYASLPRGPIHGDLFRDNVLFQGGALTGVFDFYFAGVDTLLFDIAVALNDWCIDLSSGRLDDDRAEALVGGYAGVRPLEAAELRLLPALMRAAAFRFWLSRTWDLHLPRDAVVLQAHDPDHFEQVLLQRRDAPWHGAGRASP